MSADSDLQARVDQLESVVADLAGNPATRRTFLGFAGGAATAAFLSARAGAQAPNPEDKAWTGSFAHLLGPRDARPSPRGDNRFIYWADDTDEIYYTTWDNDTWNKFGEFGTTGGSGDTRVDVSDDGSLVVTDASDIDFNALLDVTDDGDTSVTVDVDESGISHDGLDQTTVDSDDHHTRYTDEEAQDAIGAILSAQFTYDDAGDAINLNPHANDADAHHAKTTSFGDLTDTASLAQLAAILDGDNDIELEHLGSILDGGNDVETEHLANALQLPGAVTSPNLALDTWRTPNANRPTFVTLSVLLNPGSITAAELALDVDESGGTTADYSHHNRVPSALSAEQIRPFVSILVPAGGSYQVRTVSSGDEVAIDEHTEQTL